MIWLAVAVPVALLIGFVAGQLFERKSLKNQRDALLAQSELLTRVTAFKEPQAAAQWQKAIATPEPPKTGQPTESEKVRERLQALADRHPGLRHPKVTVSRSGLVTLSSVDQAGDPIIMNDYPEREVRAWLESGE